MCMMQVPACCLWDCAVCHRQPWVPCNAEMSCILGCAPLLASGNGGISFSADIKNAYFCRVFRRIHSYFKLKIEHRGCFLCSLSETKNFSAVSFHLKLFHSVPKCCSDCLCVCSWSCDWPTQVHNAYGALAVVQLYSVYSHVSAARFLNLSKFLGCSLYTSEK